MTSFLALCVPIAATHSVCHGMRLDNRIAPAPAFRIARRLGEALEKERKIRTWGYGHILGGRIFITLFPAYAGVIPERFGECPVRPALPRACGGDSVSAWSRAISTVLFPAYAGVIPVPVFQSIVGAALPRAASRSSLS